MKSLRIVALVLCASSLAVAGDPEFKGIVDSIEHTYGVPTSKIAVTPMIGLNDNASETFTTADVSTLSSYATSNGLAGLHFWSLDRDTPCSDTFASPTCNSISSTTPLEYTNRFLSDLGI